MVRFAGRLPKLGAILFITACMAISMVPSRPASALSGNEFNAGHIIDDSVFTNANSMTLQEIQNFLTAKVPTCSTNHSGFTGTTGTVYNPPFVCLKDFYENPNASYAIGFSYTDKNGNPQSSSRTYYVNNAYRVTGLCPVYVGYTGTPSCGSGDYHGGLDHLIPTLQTSGLGIPSGGQSAAQIIYNAAHQYNINPQTLIVLLQKEQGLVTDDWPASYEYQSATGYGCPDTAPCSSTYAGFSNQVISAAWQFRHYMDSPNDYNYVVGNNYIQYNPVASCGGTNVNIQNQATAALYDYTPYQPNSGALSSMSDSSPGGTATCGAYGNRNFWWYFNTWFGSTNGLDYSWAFQSIDLSTGSSQVMGNTQATVTLTAKNTGRQAWSSTNYPVRLATWAPTDHNSALYDPSWVSKSRLATVSPATVLPGQNGTFTFKINVPNISGAYDEQFNLVADGAAWMPDVGFDLHLVVTKSTYTWQMVSQSSSKGFTLAPGSAAQFTLVAKNTGNTTWTNGTNPVRLGTWAPTNRTSNFYDSSWLSQVRPAVLQEASVAPGQNGTFVFNVTAPQNPGFYAERFNLAMDGVSWFDDPWMEFDVNVVRDLSWQMVSQSSSTGSFGLSPNQTATFTLVAKNTGNMTWSNTNNPVRLGTWQSPNRSSAFYDSSWINPARAAVLQEASVAPGQNGTFVFKVKAPATRKAYVERFNLAMDGVAWFNDPWMEFDINVQ
jgi:hypothetical protein